MSAIRLLVGLGNPGREHERTRHNAGFWLVERFAASAGIALRKDAKYQALVGRHAPSGAELPEEVRRGDGQKAGRRDRDGDRAGVEPSLRDGAHPAAL